MVKLHNVDFSCEAPYLENEVVFANFALNSQPPPPAEVTRILPVKSIDSSALREGFSYEVPIPRLAIVPVNFLGSCPFSACVSVSRLVCLCFGVVSVT